MIKVIATDMDGTFLRDDKTFDRQRFARVLKKLEERDIKFVIASGNQHCQLRLNFPQYDQRLTYVSENGSHVVTENQTIWENFIERQTALDCLNFLQEKFPQALNMVICKDMAYLLTDADSKTIDVLKSYLLPKMQLVECFEQMPEDPIFQLTVWVPEELTQQVVTEVSQTFADRNLTGTSSGPGSIDIIISGMHKGKGLSYLLDYWGLEAANLMCFGDGGNDIEMLKLAGQSYVMANAPENIRKLGQLAPSNNDDGVLQVIESYLDRLGKEDYES
ncbi:haloacid dehalogenase-like hydrolase [Streptococcus criceti]|uniref:Hydrolase, haloacid dehalogenase-like family protein n=1 Tax=Streptococcus criceti HS-6 TaxID=873449 RepID=G5JPV0_STRCG|nr:Cof-type HAD-IIB family hydrolase [Streptococcus criceti]EHI73528.1 hydrolase, haloacid dehalogenase-like family protein [Streptococcus criceti HS-6]SUN43206.1 haloacid dehalogenase-like hydrolase [Streptococcus criceti]